MRLIEKKLCPKGKAAAKRKFSVYPSAYANMYASAVCSGKVKPGGKKKVNEVYDEFDDNLTPLEKAILKKNDEERAKKKAQVQKKVNEMKNLYTEVKSDPLKDEAVENMAKAKKRAQEEKEKKLMNLALKDEEEYRKRTGKPPMPAALKRRR